MSAAQSPLRLVSFYDDGDIDILFDGVEYSYERIHVATFQSRKNVRLPQAIELAMELPRGAFIAGGFMKSIMHQVPVREYDLYFSNAECLFSLVRRIHNAPEGTFLHGYTSDKSLRDFADSETVFVDFTHPSKPTLQLHRLRWFSRPEEAIDKFDFRMCQFALDADLNMIFSANGITDIRDKRLYMIKAVFPLSTGLRLKRLEAAGWQWMTGHYDNYYRDDYLRMATDHLRKATRKATNEGRPAVENIDGYGAYLV